MSFNAGQAKPMDAAMALILTRAIWVALLFGQVAFAVVTVVLISAGELGDATTLHPLLFYISAAIFALAMLVGGFVRNQIYKRSWRGHAVAPGGYVAGNVTYLALLEGAGLFGIITTLTTGVWAGMGVAGLAVAVQILNFPNGRAMRESPPPFAAREDQPG